MQLRIADGDSHPLTGLGSGSRAGVAAAGLGPTSGLLLLTPHAPRSARASGAGASPAPAVHEKPSSTEGSPHLVMGRTMAPNEDDLYWAEIVCHASGFVRSRAVPRGCPAVGRRAGSCRWRRRAYTWPGPAAGRRSVVPTRASPTRPDTCRGLPRQPACESVLASRTVTRSSLDRGVRSNLHALAAFHSRVRTHDEMYTRAGPCPLIDTGLATARTWHHPCSSDRWQRPGDRVGTIIVRGGKLCRSPRRGPDARPAHHRRQGRARCPVHRRPQAVNNFDARAAKSMPRRATPPASRVGAGDAKIARRDASRRASSVAPRSIASGR